MRLKENMAENIFFPKRSDLRRRLESDMQLCVANKGSDDSFV